MSASVTIPKVQKKFNFTRAVILLIFPAYPNIPLLTETGYYQVHGIKQSNHVLIYFY
jgi:hypothetical protein